MYDSFVAELTCPACGSRPVRAEIQTYLRGVDADGSWFGVGDRIELPAGAFDAAGYLPIGPAPCDGPVRLLGVWSAWCCGTDQWASVEITGDRVTDIQAVVLDRTTLDAAHHLPALDAELVAAGLLGGRPSSGDVVEDLRRLLPR